MSIRPNIQKLNKIFKELDQQPVVDIDPEFPPAERNVRTFGPTRRKTMHGIDPVWIPPNWNGEDDLPGFR